MAGALQLIGTNPNKIKHFELPNELRHSLFRASELVQRRAPGVSEHPMPTSLESFDRVLGGGLPRGSLVELVGRGSCGRFAALLAALRAVTGAGEAAALVDQGCQLDPRSAAELGIDLERLLWLRPNRLDDSLSASELLLHTGFQLVALDLGLPPVRGRAPLAAWLRLARAAAAHGTVVLVGTPYRLSGCAAAAVVTGGWSRGDWDRAGYGRLLRGLHARLSLSKRTGHPDLGGAGLELSVAEASFGPTLSGDEVGAGKSEIPNSKSEIPVKRRKHDVAAV
jgi:hypothetical protein